MLKFRHIKIIETTATEKIAIAEKNLYAGPMPIADIEDIEDRLIKLKIPYVLIEAETTLPIETREEAGGQRYARGYFLFVTQVSV